MLRTRFAALFAASVAALGGCAGERPSLEPDAEAAPSPSSARPGAEAPPPTDLSGEIDLPTLFAVAFRENPRLAAARSRWEAQIEKLPIETALPEPMFEYAYGVYPTETRTGPMEHRFMLRQDVPFPTKLIAVGEVVEAEVRVAKSEFEIAVRDVLVELARAYYQLWSLEESRQITLENQELLRTLLAHVTSEHAAGRANFAEVQRAQAQLAQLDYDLVTIAELLAVQRTMVNSLLSRPPSSAIGTPDSVPAPGGVRGDLETLYAEAQTHRPELARDAAMIEKAEKDVEAARQMYFPNFSLGVEYMATGKPEERELREMDEAGMDDFYVTFGLELPVWVPKYRAGVRKALAEKRAAEADRANELNEATAKVAEAYFAMRNSARLVRLYAESLLPQAAHSLATAREWYEAGKGSYSQFLELQQVVFNYELALVRATADYYRELADLERAVGRPLPEVVELLGEGSR